MGCRQCDKYRGMLEDVISELDLSDSVINEHSALGTPPSYFVREILRIKDMEIAMLKNEMKKIEYN